MPDIYIQPTDLSAAQAQQVLDFLNRATSAEQLARDIEFPHEPDIGVKLGQRLLDARAALGGQFTDILQVRSVRLIGPERFTEICITALGLMPERWVEVFYGGSPMGVPTETGLAVSLDVLPQPAWLGQPLTVTVRVRDLGGTARAGVAVTLQTGVGRFAYQFGFSHIEGQAVTVLTGSDGSAEVDLITPPAEPLSEIQQSALEVALAHLDAAANDPLKLEADFRRMAADYTLERNYNLRRAIDIYVRERRDAMVNSLNPGRWRMAWPIDSGLIQADALSPDGGGGSTARAVATVTWKNWIGAWLEFLGDVLRDSTQLDARLGSAGQATQGEALLGNLLLETQRALVSRPGLSAEWVGKRAVEEAVKKFVGGDLTKLAPSAQAAVVSELEVAAAGVGKTNLGSYTLVSKTKAELVGQIDNLELVNLTQLQRMEALASGVESTAARVDTQAAAVTQNRLAVDQQVASFNTQYATFNTQISQFTVQFGQFNTNLATFDVNRTTLTTQLSGLQADLGAVRLDVNRLSGLR